MALYIGFYNADPDFARETGARARAGDNTPDPTFVKKVVELREKLPASLKLLGSYGTRTPDRPNVWIGETDNPADLSFVSNYYTGYLTFDWVPASVVGTTTNETKANMDAAGANR